MGINENIYRNLSFQVVCSLSLSWDCNRVYETHFATSYKEAVAEFRQNGWKCKRDTFEWVCPECVKAERDQMLDEIKRKFDEQEQSERREDG